MSWVMDKIRPQRDTVPKDWADELKCLSSERNEIRNFARNLASATDALVQKLHDNNIDTIVLLDGGARPLTYLIVPLWRYRYPNTPVPKIAYFMGTKRSNGTNDKVEKDLERLQKPTSVISRAQRLAVVDEMIITGTTSEGAKKFIEQNWPHKEAILVMSVAKLRGFGREFAEENLFSEKFLFRPPWSSKDESMSEFRDGLGVMTKECEEKGLLASAQRKATQKLVELGQAKKNLRKELEFIADRYIEEMRS